RGAIEAGPLVFTLEPGDTFYVWATLFATADSRDATPSSADAFHTLTMQFDDASGLVPATVPEPGEATAMAWALVVLGALARRGRRDRAATGARNASTPAS